MSPGPFFLSSTIFWVLFLKATGFLINPDMWRVMDKYSIDYNQLEINLEKPKAFRYEDVKHRLEKVAFGTVRFMDANDDIDGLWEIQNTDDGDVIVAKYDYEDSQNMTSTSSWDVVPSRRGDTINIFYKGEPITAIASDKFGASVDISAICKQASIKLASDSQFKDMLLDELSGVEKARILRKYPELTE